MTRSLSILQRLWTFYQLHKDKYLGGDHDIDNLYETRYKIIRTEIGSLFETPDPDPKLLDFKSFTFHQNISYNIP